MWITKFQDMVWKIVLKCTGSYKKRYFVGDFAILILLVIAYFLISLFSIHTNVQLLHIDIVKLRRLTCGFL